MTDTQVRRAIDRPVHEVDTDAEPPQPDHIVLARRLQTLYPHAAPAMIERSIDEAIALFSNARVQQFLPILIERTAAAVLRTGVGSGENDAANPRRVCGPPL